MAAKKKLPSSAVGAIVIVALLILGYLFWRSQFAGAPAGGSLPVTREGSAEQPTGSFEFRGPGYVEVEDPREATIIIVKSPGAKNARPITITAKADGKTVSETTISADEENCADEDTCSELSPDEVFDELEARDKDGNLIATYQG